MARIVRPVLSALALLLPGIARAADFQHALIVILDDLGTDKVGAYAEDVDNPGEQRPETPTLDLLAATGVRFSDAWAAPVCSPTRAMLLTGEKNHRNGIGDAILEAESDRLDTSPDSLQQYAAAGGLATGLFGKWHLGETNNTPDAATASPLDYADLPVRTGFDIFAGTTGGAVPSYTSWLYERSEPDPTQRTGYRTTAVDATTNVTDTTTDDAVAWMEEQAALGARRLTVVSYNLAHTSGGDWDDAARSCGLSPGTSDTETFGLVVECLDDELAELFDRTPDLDETLVIVLGDNGTVREVGEGLFHDGRGKGTVFESGVRVPFLVADGAALRDALDNGGETPDGGYVIDAGAVVADPTSIVDVFATVGDLLDLTSPTCTVPDTCGTDSVSLRSVLTGGPAARDQVWTETFANGSGGLYTGQGALRVGDLKLVVRAQDDGGEPCMDYTLYDLAADRWEENDVFHDAAYALARAELLSRFDDEAAASFGSEWDWLNYADCAACAATETWYDGIDGDCLGGSDFDQDGDGLDALDFGGTDCDDTDPAVFPGAFEVWYDGVDADCAGDDDFDQDGDGLDTLDFGGTDCDDTDPAVFPGAFEVWYDGVDADCAGDDDFDQDGDGFSAPEGGGTDCDDTIPRVYPGAPETWYNAIDENCDGLNDFDRDRDGFTSADWGGLDCADANPRRYPGRGC